MINRTLVRTKIIQTLFAFYKNGESSTISARKELLSSFSSTYSLYMMLLAFANELTTYAEEQIAAEKKRATISHQAYVANKNFVNNRVAQQLFNNRRLRSYMEEQHLRWDVGMHAVSAIYKELVKSSFYQEYMQLENPSYEDDKRVWRKIYSTLLPTSDDFYSALEEMEIALDNKNWTVDADIVLTYVDKTIKRFDEKNGDEQVLIEMFNNEDELNFANQLLRLAIEHADEYRELIGSALQNWEAERVAYMDQIILITALTEIINFQDIALEISMNEYIELAKEYSSEKSYVFINGVLDKIVNNLRKENKIFKFTR